MSMFESGPIEKLENPILRSKIYIDPVTNQLVYAGAIIDSFLESESSNSRPDWAKLFIGFLDKLSKACSSQTLDVLIFMINRMSIGTNEFSFSRTYIAKETSISKPTINRAFATMKKHDIIRMVNGSVCMINPDFLYIGGKEKEVYLRKKYNDLPKPETTKVSLEDDDIISRNDEESASSLVRKINACLKGDQENEL